MKAEAEGGGGRQMEEEGGCIYMAAAATTIVDRFDIMLGEQRGLQDMSASLGSNGKFKTAIAFQKINGPNEEN